jgi:hypothetical protein
MIIRKAEKKDLKKIAEMHMKNIYFGFITKLGENFLYLVYESLVDFKEGIIFISVERGDVTGFVSGTLDTRKFYLFFLKRNLFRLFLFFPEIIRNSFVINPK